MKLEKITAAYQALCRLAEQECEYQTAHALLTVKQMLLPHIQFYADEELKLARAFAKKDERGEPMIRDGRFEIEGDAALYRSKRAALDAVEVEIQPISIPGLLRMRANDLEALEGIAYFGGEQ